MAAAAPDPETMKARARDQWDQAAEAWYRWRPTIEAWLAPVTEIMIEMAGVRPGDRVLDIAAGAGEPAVTLARRVGQEGSVLATDISPAILEFARRHAAEEGVANVAVRVADGERLGLPDASFDAAVSRLGLIYFPDRIGALREIHRVLKPGGRVAIVGITSPAANPFSARTMRVIATRAGLPPPPPDTPGPFSLGTEALMGGALAAAGFTEVAMRIVAVPLRMASGRECARLQRDAFGGLDQLLARLPPQEREAAWDEVAGALSGHERVGAFESPTEFIVGAGRRT